MTWLLGLFGVVAGNWLRIVTVSGMVALATLAGAFWLRAKSAESKLVEAAVLQEQLEGQVSALKIVVAGKEDAIKELEATSAELQKQSDELKDILSEIRRAAPKGKLSKEFLDLLRRIDIFNDPK